ncbi:MAG: hypothetical protein RJA70_68 [Pseudomonadota bacterium]
MSSGVTDEWTVARVLTWAATDFRGRGFDSPRLDAELLLCAVLKCDRVRLIVDATRPLVLSELNAYRELIQRRRRAEPIAYILGVREFFGMPFRVDARVLIPRPDTEILVETALRRTAHRHLFGTAIDVCTGSGCVAIAFAKQRPTWWVRAGDISPEALSLARDNAHHLGALPFLSFHQSDLLSAFTPRRKLSLITANPPYIPSSELPQLPADVRDFEPRLALDGGADGLDFVRRLALDAIPHLASGGVLALEIAHDQAPRTERILGESGFVDLQSARDYGGHERVVSGVRP